MKFIRTRNYLPIWKKNLSWRIKQCILEIISKVYLLLFGDIWWTIKNSIQNKNSMQTFGLVTQQLKMTKKPLFLWEFANRLEDWQSLQSKNSQKFTLNKQANTALVITLRCIASLIEDLLMEKKCKYVLTSLFQTDCLESRCSTYRQMIGGRFLFGLRDMQGYERILSTMSFLKASLNIWNEVISPDANDESMWSEFERDLQHRYS